MVKPTIFEDPRGSFVEMYKRSEFVTAGIIDPFVQDNYSHSVRGRAARTPLSEASSGAEQARLRDRGRDLRRGGRHSGRVAHARPLGGRCSGLSRRGRMYGTRPAPPDDTSNRSNGRRRQGRSQTMVARTRNSSKRDTRRIFSFPKLGRPTCRRSPGRHIGIEFSFARHPGVSNYPGTGGLTRPSRWLVVCVGGKEVSPRIASRLNGMVTHGGGQHD